jgi:hypothetical protein
MTTLVGADPELFTFEGDTPVSGHGLIPGDKEDPHPVEDGAVQVDGMALEFNIAPADNEECFVNNIHSVMAQLKSMVPDKELLPIPSVDFGEEYMAAQPKEAKELGCLPDNNAWLGGVENVPPDERTTIRAAGGHVHLGWCEDANVHDPEFLNDCCELAKQLDYMLGVPSVFLDSDTVRRSLYGKAGAFRPKPYGLEYRVLSNFWLKDEQHIRWVYSTAVRAIELLKEGMKYEDLHGMAAYDIINRGDVEAAKALTAELGLEVPHEGNYR